MFRRKKDAEELSCGFEDGVKIIPISLKVRLEKASEVRTLAMI